MAVFAEAFRGGAAAYWAAITDEETLAALRLTLLVVVVAVPLNVVFGLAAAWAIARFHFPGKSVLLTLIDLPFAVSPVIAGMIYVLLFGAHGLLGPALLKRGVHVIFAAPGIALATTFVTFPFVARELVPLLESRGPEEEEAALVLGASAFQMFLRVTLPNVRWGLLYGVVLATARAMGEFGARQRGLGPHPRRDQPRCPCTSRSLYNEYRFSAAFSVASILVLLSLVTLVAKRLLERKAHGSPTEENRPAGDAPRRLDSSSSVSSHARRGEGAVPGAAPPRP